MKKDITEWEVLTDSGWSNFTGIKESTTNQLVHIKLSNNKELKCTLNHKIFISDNEYILAKNLNVNDTIKYNNKQGYIKVISINIINETCKVYDLLNVENNARYYTNGILSHNCAFIPENIAKAFWASVYPVISSAKGTKVVMVSTPKGIGNLFYDTYNQALLNISSDGWTPFRIDWWDVPGRDEEWKQKQIASLNFDMRTFNQEFGNKFLGSSFTLIDSGKIQIFKDNQIKKWTGKQPITKKFKNWEVNIYHEPQPKRAYIIGADIGEGLGGDFSTIEVLDITDITNIIEVASYRSNYIDTTDFSYLLVKVGKFYNYSPILFEANSVGNTIIDSLWNIYEYDNLIQTLRSNKQLKPGIYSHNSEKNKACLFTNKLTKFDEINIEINNPHLIDEMTYFEGTQRKKVTTFEAIKTKHDDVIMAFIWALRVLMDDLIYNYYDVKKHILIGIKEYPHLVSPININYYINDSNLNEDKIYNNIHSSKQERLKDNIDEIDENINNENINNEDVNNEDINNEDTPQNLAFFSDDKNDDGWITL